MRYKEKVKGDNNRKRAYTYLTQEKGLEPHVASAILGNFAQESGPQLNVKAYNPDDLGLPTLGLAQWRGDRLEKLKKIAGDRANTLEGQLDFMMWEFRNTEKRAFKKLQEASSLEEATLAFSKYYERPHKDYAHNDKRINYAREIYNTFEGLGPVVIPETEGRREIAGPQTQEEVLGPVPDQGELVENEPVPAPHELDQIGPLPEQDQIGYYTSLFNNYQPKKEEKEKENVKQAKQNIDQSQNRMAILQELIQASQVQYVEPENTRRPERRMQGGGEARVPRQEEVQQESVYTSFPGIEPLPRQVFIKEPPVRRGREKQPLNLRVQESTQVRDTAVDPTFTSIAEGEYDEFTDPQNMNISDILNPIEITHDRRRHELEENVKKKSEFLNPLGMEKIDPNSLQSEEDIRRVQGQLMENGYDLSNFGADGKMGRETLEAINKFNTKLSLNEELSLGDFKTTQQVKQLQEFLINKGYDLNPSGRFQDDGVDGRIGEVTKKALREYNQKTFGQDKLPYKGVKDGEGFLGNCQEEQCSEYVQNEIYRNLNPNLSRTEWNKKTGITGDAWTIGKNILNAGGRKVKQDAIAPGDIITIYTGGVSNYQKKADEEGEGTTHTAVVDQVNDDGTYYVLHNVHKWVPGQGYQGREYRDLMYPDGRMKGRFNHTEVRGIYRPNAEEVTGKSVKPLRKDVGLTLNPNRQADLEGINSVLGNATEKIQTYIEPLNDFTNKNKISQIFELEEDEYQSLAQLTIGVIGQETNFGTNPMMLVKEPVARASNLVNRLTDGNFADSSLIKGDEASRGAGRLKYDTNFHSDLTEFGINKKNFTEDKNVPITSLYKIATDYNRMKKQGYSKKDALYRAAVLYNASLQGKSNGKTREEWADNYDVDYANKAINLGSSVTVAGEDKEYKTLIDELLLEDNVYKWNKRTFQDRNRI